MCAMSPRLLRPVASGFSPKSISGLAAWYDASVSSSITIQTGVQKWADLSGNGRDLIQNVTNNQPAHGSVTLNGKPTVTFDGSNDSLRTGAFTVSQPYTFIAVFRFEAAYVSGSPRIFDAGNPATHRSGEVFRQDENDVRMYASPGGGTVVGSAAPSGSVTAFNIWDFEFNGSSSVLRYRKNVYTASGAIGGNGALRLTMGADLNATPASLSNASVAEFLMYGKVLPASEADKIRAYLGKKYNLAYQA
jgi:hypothetical protein